MNEEMKQAWLEISDMLGEPTREELDVFLRTWQRAMEAQKQAPAEQAAQRTWVGLTDEEMSDIWCVVTNRDFVTEETHVYADAIEAKLKEKNT